MRTITKTTTLALALILLGSVAAQAQEHRGRVIVVSPGPFYGPYYNYYDPFWGPFYPYAEYPYATHPTTDVKVQVTPKQADIYVDGYRAGMASDFGGLFKRLHATPGGHAITVHMDGYRTITENVYLRPGSTFTLKANMEKLAAGEVSAPVPAPSPKG